MLHNRQSLLLLIKRSPKSSNLELFIYLSSSQWIRQQLFLHSCCECCGIFHFPSFSASFFDALHSFRFSPLFWITVFLLFLGGSPSSPLVEAFSISQCLSFTSLVQETSHSTALLGSYSFELLLDFLFSDVYPFNLVWPKLCCSWKYGTNYALEFDLLARVLRPSASPSARPNRLPPCIALPAHWHGAFYHEAAALLPYPFCPWFTLPPLAHGHATIFLTLSTPHCLDLALQS